MKSCLVASMFVVLSYCTILPAQTVGGTAPVVMQTEYISSSSPLSDGRRVTSYYSPQVSPQAQTTSAPRVVYSQETGSRIVYQPTSTTVTSANTTPTIDPYYGTRTVQSVGQTVYAGNCCDPCANHYPTVSYYPSTSTSYAGNAYPSNYGSRYAYSPGAPNQQLPSGAYVGSGLIGQPKLYMDGQPLRNSLRFIFP